jgi:hypothetical protein
MPLLENDAKEIIAKMLAWIFISALFIVVKKLQIAVFMNN